MLSLTNRNDKNPSQLVAELRQLESLFCGQEPGGLDRGALAVPDQEGPVWQGTTVPALVRQFAPNASGLLVPTSVRRPAPIDAMATFMTATEIVGRPLSLEEVVGLLQAVSLQDALMACGWLMAQLQQEARSRRDIQLDLVDQLCDATTKSRARAMVKDRWVFLAPQVVLGVVKLSLSLDHVARTSGGTDALRNVVLAELGLAQFLPGRGPDPERQWGSLPEGLSLELIANQHFNASTPTAAAIARYQMMWHEIPHQLEPSVAAAHECAFLDATGTTMEECHRVGMVLMTHVLVHKNANLPPDYLASLELTESERRAVDLYVADENHLQMLLRNEIQQFGFNWAANTFRRYPIIRHQDRSMTVLSSEFLRDRACGSAIYWELDQHFVPRSKHWGRFKRFRGLVAEDYVRHSLESMFPKLADGAQRLWTERDLKQIWPRKKVCDFVVDVGEAWLCVEVVSHVLSAGASTATSVDALNGDVRMMVEEKVEQLDSTARSLLGNGAEVLLGLHTGGPNRVLPVLIATSGVPVNPITMTVIQERLTSKTLLQHQQIGQLEILDLYNLEALEAVMEKGGPTLAQLLEDKASAGLRLASMDQYLAFERHLDLQRPSRLQRPLDEAQDGLLRWAEQRLRPNAPAA